MDTTSLLKEFNQAVNEEIAYIKESGGDKKITLRNGQLVNSIGGKFIYEFITDSPLELEDDTPVSIRYGGESINGGIVSVKGLNVLISLNNDLGSKMPEVTLSVNACFLLELLLKRLNEIESRKINFNFDLAMKTFGFQNGVVGEDSNFLTPFNDLKLLISEEQRNALAKALGSEVTFIWGPPGTGKTTVLSYLVNEFLSREKSILLISHTNVAIDNALEQTAKILKNKKDQKYFSGLILRIGNSPDEHYFDRLPELDLSYWEEVKGRELNKKILELEEKLGKENSRLSDLDKICRLATAISKTEAEVDKITFNIENIGKNIKKTDNNIERINGEILIINEKINKSKNFNLVKRIITNLDPKKLEKKLINSNTVIEKEKISLINLNLQLEKQEQIFRTTKEELKKYKAQTAELLGKLNLNSVNLLEKTKKQEQIIADINKEIDLIKIILQGLSGELIKTAKLLGTTITKGYINEDIYNRKFDVVIVDEASMAPLPALFFDCGLSAEKTVIVGDFRQLSPIAMSGGELAEKWLKSDIFQISGMAGKVKETGEDPRMAILKEQRRMPKEIADLVNKIIYENKLVTKNKPEDRDKKEKDVIASQPFPGERVVFCDTSEFNPWCTRSPISRSPFNLYHAFLSVYLAEQALLSGVEEIVILTPYRAQNRLIHKLIADKALVDSKFRKIIPSSVHRFQGRESELIIFDLVEGPMREIKWLGGGFDSDAMRLINVGITRTKSKIIFVAHLKYLEEKLQNGSILKEILRDAKKSNPIIDAQKFFPLIKISSKENEIIKLDDKPKFFNQAFFYKAFESDLMSAERRIVILSPFLTTNRISSFENIFRNLYEKKVKIFVITKPFGEQKLSQEFGRELIYNLKKINIEVITRPLLHEKLAIIDGKIIWQGSLNILSHNNTSELMMRFVTKETKFSDETLKLCGINIERIMEDNIIDKKISELNKEGIGFCPRGHKFNLKKGSLGLFISCSHYPSCDEKLPLTTDIIGQVFGEQYLRCEKCGSSMLIKFNPKRKSRFLGCSQYPNCRFTRPL